MTFKEKERQSQQWLTKPGGEEGEVTKMVHEEILR